MNGEIKKLVVLHADHYEPNGNGIIVDGNKKTTDEYVKRKMDIFESLDWSVNRVKPTLFVHLPMSVNNRLGKMEIIVNKKTELMLEHLKNLKKVGIDDIQVHIHHENWTNNDVFKRNNPGHVPIETDQDRLRKFITLHRTLLAENGLQVFSDPWFFVHGKWALNAADTEICSIEDEIKVLYKLGCRGDFTFPAGRKSYDPATKNAMLMNPNLTGRMCYNTANNISVNKNIDPKMFFIYNQSLPVQYASIEHIVKSKREGGIKNNEFINMWLLHSISINGVNYIKTHCHSMNDIFFLNEDKTDFRKKCDTPLMSEEYRGLLKQLQDKCTKLGIELQYQTIKDFYNANVGK
jgi:hypothetical protein